MNNQHMPPDLSREQDVVPELPAQVEVRALEVVDRGGPEAFETTERLQREITESKRSNRSRPDVLILVEHEAVYTAGRGSPFQHPIQEFAQQVPWVETNRGGQATYHGPGQLVAYPIFDLTRHDPDIHRYLRRLEQTVIRALSCFEVDGYTREGLTGVWVRHPSGDERKIASIGVGVRSWVTCHGLALNVCPDLEFFRAIAPCGQDGRIMTSLESFCAAQKSEAPGIWEVKNALVRAFVEEFGFAQTEFVRAASGRPPWLRVKAPGSPEYLQTQGIVRQLHLHTVCEEAHCPNQGECWTHQTATFLIMGDQCTRRCAFCSVKDGTLSSLNPLDPFEPYRVGKAVQELHLRHVVVTSVDRDDLEDQGAAHFDQTVRAIRNQNPDCRIELLIPDMRGKAALVRKILESGAVDVLNHNVETVPRLYHRVRPGAGFDRSLRVLQYARDFSLSLRTKSGIMVGLGETQNEVLEVMDALRSVDCSILTVGQYLQPTSKQLPVQRYVTPEEFEFYRAEGLRRGFSFVESGPLVRSSYHAWKHTADLLAPNSIMA